jgi:hypothetical protein
VAAGVSAQFGRGMGGPELRGIWSPVVGSGSAYATESRQGKAEMEVAIVGKEMVGADTGYWLEMYMSGQRGTFIIKNLMVVTGKEVGSKRRIMQMGDQEPMEFDEAMMQMMPGQGQRANLDADVREKAEKVGTESITTPAGIFECEHWRLKDGSGEVWVSAKVVPYGIVKSVGKDGSMTLTKVLTDAKSRIKGTPRKFDPSQMMGRPPQ